MTKDWFETTAREAWLTGWNGAHAVHPPHLYFDNPYLSGSETWVLWREGYLAGRLDWNDGEEDL